MTFMQFGEKSLSGVSDNLKKARAFELPFAKWLGGPQFIAFRCKETRGCMEGTYSQMSKLSKGSNGVLELRLILLKSFMY